MEHGSGCLPSEPAQPCVSLPAPVTPVPVCRGGTRQGGRGRNPCDLSVRRVRRRHAGHHDRRVRVARRAQCLGLAASTSSRLVAASTASAQASSSAADAPRTRSRTAPGTSPKRSSRRRRTIPAWPSTRPSSLPSLRPRSILPLESLGSSLFDLGLRDRAHQTLRSGLGR